MSKKLIFVLILVGFVAAVALTGLILAGVNYFGPLKSLAISHITNKYDKTKTQGQIVFYGASNFARWSDMETDLAPYPVQNHGFGGSADKDLVYYADVLLFPYDPKVVVFQTGSNDYVQITGTDEEKIQTCMDNKRAMYASFHEKLPDAVFVVMSGLLLPGRSEYLDLTLKINEELQALCDETDYMLFVDANAMTYDGTSFKTELFGKDGIHLNRDGQILWADEYILPALEQACALAGCDAS